MALRTFTDSTGTDWTVWDVRPPRVYPSVRALKDRRRGGSVAPELERRRGADRRRRTIPREIAYGWVCFQSDAEKRRLCPPPADWTDRTDGELERMCREAAPSRS